MHRVYINAPKLYLLSMTDQRWQILQYSYSPSSHCVD